MWEVYILLRLIRIQNCLMTAAGVWLGAHLTGEDYSETVIYFASLVGALVCAAGNLFNDITDIDIDRVNHPQRPLPSGDITLSAAAIAALLLVFISQTISLFVSGVLAIATAVSLALLALYNILLKKLPLAGNATVATLGAFPLALGALLAAPKSLSHIPGPIVATGFAFLIHLTREILKDLVDWEGDNQASYKTLPSFLKPKYVILLVAALMTLLAVLVLITAALDWYNQYYTFTAGTLVALPLLLLAVFITSRQDIDRHRVAASVLKLIMVAGMIAFLVGRK
ncbi:MAG: geranylgeranylglycerol-phosphate geranylgeranyltransferase [bacterium]|jgi:geranylgeranylglycerol-phosphate geranylgeranyltransferase